MYPTYIKTDAKLLHNNDGIYVKFESEEHPIHINYRYHNGEIYKDSTVEIFIAPNKNSVNYFNFEIEETAEAVACTSDYYKFYNNKPENLEGSFFNAQKSAISDEMKSIIDEIKNQEWYESTEI